MLRTWTSTKPCPLLLRNCLSIRMSSYPYPQSEHFPEDIQSLDYRLDWNGRFESGDRTQLYQFHYVAGNVGTDLSSAIRDRMVRQFSAGRSA